jgi:hypothetical protein
VRKTDDAQEMEKALEDDLLVGVVLVVAFEVLGVVFEVLSDLEMVDR